MTPLGVCALITEAKIATKTNPKALRIIEDHLSCGIVIEREFPS
jgi:hypothetical protein